MNGRGAKCVWGNEYGVNSGSVQCRFGVDSVSSWGRVVVGAGVDAGSIRSDLALIRRRFQAGA